MKGLLCSLFLLVSCHSFRLVDVTSEEDAAANSANTQSNNNNVNDNPEESAAKPTPAGSSEEPKRNREAKAVEAEPQKEGEPPVFHPRPKSKRARRLVARGEAPEDYVVEYGDTLFDVCSQLLDEGDYWPKLWTLNNYIKNPHFIWPGMRLRFFPGDDESPPALEIVTEDDVVPTDNAVDMPLARLVAEDLQPYNERLSIGNSEVVGISEVDDLQEKFLTFGEIFGDNQTKLVIPGFIFATEQNPSCNVLSGSFGETIVGEGEQFVCDIGRDAVLLPNHTYTALRFVQDFYDSARGEHGYQYEFVAQVKMQEILADSGKAIGTILHSRLGLEPDDILVPYRSTQRFVRLSNEGEPVTNAGHQGKILSFGDPAKEIGGQGDFVFIDGGKDAGFVEGKLLTIQQDLKHLTFAHVLADLPVRQMVAGYVRIIDSTEVGSVGYIVYSKQEIFVGDFVGKG